MKREERLKKAFDFLKDNGLAHTQKDIAETMGASRSNVSSAFNGVDSVLTDKFLIRFNSSYGGCFNQDWLLTGNGEMLASSPVLQSGDNNIAQTGNGTINTSADSETALVLALNEIAEQRKLTATAQQQIDRLLSLLEKSSGL